jgi:ssDNA-binding replication factor A large subunit
LRASLNHQRNLIYLSKIIIKYDLSPEKIVNYLIKARKYSKFSQEKLELRVREKTDEFTTFTLIYDEKIVSQFRLENKLMDYPESSKHKLQELILRMPPRKERQKDTDYKISELRKGLKSINLNVKVIEKSPVKEVYSRSGRKLRLSNAKVGDETGEIKLTLWNDQINFVTEGDFIRINNANVKSFRGEKMLNLSSRTGKIEIIKKEEI